MTKNFKKYISILVLLAGVIVMSCRDESLYPLPYDDRETGSFLRVYDLKSNVWDFNDLANSGFEAIYESVDRNFGKDLTKIEFYATHRSGATSNITNEVLVKTITDMSIFSEVPEPTYSLYLRSTPIRITAIETLAALSTLTTDPDGFLGDGNCTGIFPKVCTMVPYPGSVVVGDRIIYRIKIYDNKGRAFTVANPQNTVTPALGNPNEANITPNITGGLFYNSPMIYTNFVQTVTSLAPATDANAYLGDYTMKQVAIWQPDHNAGQHQSFLPGWLNKVVFGNSSSDPTQTVTLAKVPGGLSTQRQMSVKYRGQTINLVINFERAIVGQTGAGLTGANGTAALATLTTATNAPVGPGLGNGLGFPAGTTNANLGTIYIPIINSGIDCTSEREFYFTNPQPGVYNQPVTVHPVTGVAISPASALPLAAGLPSSTFPNRGLYRLDRDGLTPGDVFSISIDDDADEYGRRNGYCNWYTRIYLTLTKI
jgi:hypothetical protein